MIRRVRLHQWRSYETLDLELAPGTTFVVAPNGVGKTSLVLGLGWAVFGEHAGVDARNCIRAGADSAEVEVELVMPDNGELVITRRIGLSGRPKVTGTLDDASLDEAGINEVLEHGFGVDLGVAARLSLMLGGGHLASREALDLKSHLYNAFGVADLLATAQLAQTVAKEAERQRSAVRAATRDRLTDRAGLETEISTTQTRLEQHHEHGRELQSQARDADQTQRLAERLTTYREQQRQYDRALRELLDRVRTLVGADSIEHSATPTDVLDQLRTGCQQTERDARRSADAYAEAKGAITAATEAIELLTGDSARCPTCMRAINAGELAAAGAEQEHRLRIATEAAEQHSRAEAERRARSAAFADLLTRLELLQPPTSPDLTHEVPDLPTAEVAHAAAVEALQHHHQELGALDAKLDRLRSQISFDDRLAESDRELHLAYRREAIATAAAHAFQRTATQITEDLIEPIATEVRWRWKQLFSSDDGLTLRPDGSIVRVEAGQELGWDTLSGGERIWARVVTQLLVLASSTKLPFAWFDEPLEHLDPQLRHTVATALATATEGGNPKQLLVTTYENGLARQLAEDSPNASLINVRASINERGPDSTPEREFGTPAPARQAT